MSFVAAENEGTAVTASSPLLWREKYAWEKDPKVSCTNEVSNFIEKTPAIASPFEITVTPSGSDTWVKAFAAQSDVWHYNPNAAST